MAFALLLYMRKSYSRNDTCLWMTMTVKGMCCELQNRGRVWYLCSAAEGKREKIPSRWCWFFRRLKSHIQKSHCYSAFHFIVNRCQFKSKDDEKYVSQKCGDERYFPRKLCNIRVRVPSHLRSFRNFLKYISSACNVVNGNDFTILLVLVFGTKERR